MESLTFSSEEFDSKHYEAKVYLCEQCVYHGNNLALERWFLLSTMIFNLDSLFKILVKTFLLSKLIVFFLRKFGLFSVLGYRSQNKKKQAKKSVLGTSWKIMTNKSRNFRKKKWSFSQNWRS